MAPKTSNPRALLTVIVTILVAGGVGIMASAAEIPNSSFRVGRWDGSAYNGDNGAFNHCAVMSSQPKSTLFVFSQIVDGSVYLGFSRPSWKLPLGKDYQVTMTIDGATWGPHQVKTVGSQIIEVGPLTVRQLASLRVGYQLKLTTGSEEIVASLEDIRRAIDATAQCVAQHQRRRPNTTNAAVANASNPFESPPPGSDDKTQQVIGTLLENAGLSGTSWVKGADVGYKSAVLGWRSEHVEGALYVKEGDLSSVASALRSAAADECKGSFLATKPTAEVAGNSDVKSYEFVCNDGDASVGTAVVEVQDHQGKNNLILVNDANGRADVTALLTANEKLRQMLVNLNKPDT